MLHFSHTEIASVVLGADAIILSRPLTFGLRGDLNRWLGPHMVEGFNECRYDDREYNRVFKMPFTPCMHDCMHGCMQARVC